MPTPLTLDLSDKERRRLEQARDYHDKPYVRERATALLKIADGWSGREVALRGLLKRRKPDTVYDWFHRYQEDGFDGLIISEGRGRKPAFSPEHDSAQEARTALLSVLRRDPWPLAGQVRWSLQAIRGRCQWLRVKTDSGLWRLLDRHHLQAWSALHLQSGSELSGEARLHSSQARPSASGARAVRVFVPG